jgi:hypothetical protein
MLRLCANPKSETRDRLRLSRHRKLLIQRTQAIRRSVALGVTPSVLKSQVVAKSRAAAAEIVAVVAIVDVAEIARVIVTRRGHRDQVSLKLMPS